MKVSLSSLYRTALVTGASAGLGRAFADMLRAEGVLVWGTARNLERLPVRPNFFPLRLDLADAPMEIEKAFTGAEATAGGFDLVVNTAGYGVYESFAENDFAVWQAQLDAMLGATLRISHMAVRGMLARNHGAIVNVSSLATEFPIPFMSGYNVAKAGLSAFGESLMIEMAGTGVLVFDFRPGDYQTDFNQNMQRSTSEPTRKIRRDSPDRRLSRVWNTLEKNLGTAPPPARAAADLRRALLRGKSGVIRSGSFFQARLAPLFARLAPPGLRRMVQAWYFGAS